MPALVPLRLEVTSHALISDSLVNEDFGEESGKVTFYIRLRTDKNCFKYSVFHVSLWFIYLFTFITLANIRIYHLLHHNIRLLFLLF
jgi:hypothetical protein